MDNQLTHRTENMERICQTDIEPVSDTLMVRQQGMIQSKLNEFSQIVIKLTANNDEDTKLHLENFECDKETAVIIGLSENALSLLIEQMICKLSHTGNAKGNFVISRSLKDDTYEFEMCSENGLELTSTAISANSSETTKICLTLEIISVKKSPDILEISTEEKLNRARIYKELGTKLYKLGDISLAFKKYRRAVQYLILTQKYIEVDLADKAEEHRQLRIQCYLNMAACQMMHQSWDHVISNCSKALVIDSNNVKALYRRAQAYGKKKDYELASNDLEKAHVIEPNNRAVSKYLGNVRQLQRNETSTLASAMSKMFS